MSLTHFPHCGQTFVCSEVLGITNIREALDAFNHAAMFGDCVVSAHSRKWNLGSISGQGNTFSDLFDDPLNGVLNEIVANSSNAPFTTRHPFELVDNHNACAVTVAFRFMAEYEYRTLLLGVPNPPVSAPGVKSQRITVSIRNTDNNTAHSVIDIFYDRAGYGTIVGLAGTSAKWLDLASNTGTVNIGQTLRSDGINVITFLDEIPATLRQSNRGCAGALFLTHEFPRQPDGTPWPNGNPGSQNSFLCGPDVNDRDHPLSGITSRMSGILECEMRTFRTAAWATGTATSTVNSRVINAVPFLAANPPAMGDTATSNIHNSLNTYARAVQNIGFYGFKAAGNVRGGVTRPIVGDCFDFFEIGTQQLTVAGEIPHGATQWVLIAYLRTISGAGGQSINFTIQKPTATGSAFQSLVTTSFANSGNSGARFFRMQGSLGAAILPVSGVVEQFSLIVSSTKASPRGNVNEMWHYWDGLFSFGLKFF